LAEFEVHEDLHRDTVEWFSTLPLWFESERLRVVHACWDGNAIQSLKDRLGHSGNLSGSLIQDACREGSPLNVAVERVLKGQEIQLPKGRYFLDGYGIRRDMVRRRWWDREALTYRQAALINESEAKQLPDDRLSADVFFPVDYDRLTFFGHYCLADHPMLSTHFACVDTCAARGHRLTAYRWEGEINLKIENFRSVTI
jgi:hypothetical protein